MQDFGVLSATMRAKNRGLVGAVCLVVGLGLPGCGDDNGSSPADAGRDAESDGAADARVDTGLPEPTCHVGIACEGNADCRGGFCEPETPVNIPALGLPNGSALETSLFPGGACSPTPFADYQSLASCDISAGLGRQGCGSCGVCIPEVLSSGIFSMCRERCEASADDSGCSRSGYTCDFAYQGCVEGCRSDEECRLVPVDTDDDGVLDSQRFDPTSTATCDPNTFRCSHAGSPGARAGDPCESDEDCEADGSCILSQQTLAGFSFPGGYCSKRGCDVPGLGCEGIESACLRVRGANPGTVSTERCMLTCQRGAEADPDILGIDGHGEGCREGYRCAWDGVRGVGAADNGICVGGNYNAITVNNVGAACETSADCYSPYGQGQCLLLSVGGVVPDSGHCTITDCAAPGTPDDLCGTGNECIGLSGDASFCAQTCDAAAECAEGLACSDDDGNLATPSICYPTCGSSAECRENEACTGNAAEGLGTCT